MSRTVFGKPEYRLAFDYPHITATRAGEADSEQVFDVASATLIPDLRRLGAEIAAAGGQLTVVLPEGEVWRGRLALGATRPRDRGRAARIRAAQAMGAPAAALAVRLGRIGRDGSVPAAAVRRDTLVETRGFLARAGLRPARITGAGAFDGFPAAPRLDGASFALRPRQAIAAAGGTLAAAVLLAFLFRPDAAPPAPGLIGPVLPAAVATAEPEAEPEIAHIAPRRRPADLVRVAALPAAPKVAAAEAPAPAKAVALTDRPLVTMASRNLPDAARAPAPAPVSALRLSELNVARARLADMLMSAPLVRETVSAATSLPSPAAAFRDSGTPVAAPPPPPAVVPALVPAAAAPEPAAPRIAARRPAPRPQPDPAPAAAAPEASAPPDPAAEPAAEVAGVVRGGARPRPREAAESRISAALSAAVVTAGVSSAVQAASAPPVSAEAASPRPEPRRVAVASAAPKATPARAASARPAAPAPQRVAAVQPVRTAPQPAAARPGVPAQQIAALQPIRSAPQPAATRPAAPAQRGAAVQPARAAAPAPQRAAAVQTARPAAQPAATRPAPQTQRRVAAPQPARPAPTLAPAVARTPTPSATNSTTAAAAATERVGMSRRTVSLIGIFGPDKNRYAMVRLPNGTMQRVTAGDRIQGTQVAAIGENSVQLSGGGRTTTLTMPN